MSYLVLARKWRPQTFADVAGQGHITRTLENAIRMNRIAHAYLFTGVRGVGKTTAARILAKALNCESGPTPAPCNECTNCKEITAGISIDVLEIDGASNRGIDEIRQIIENVRYQPAKSRFKIYIIDEVHQVTKDAFNALLKTLEEPPPSVKFVLATTEPQRLPETILSRCQRYDFHRISVRDIIQRLGEIAQHEEAKLTPEALRLLAREADGSMRDAQSLLEQVVACSHGDAARAIDDRMLQDILGLPLRQTLYEISHAIIRGDGKHCIEIIAEAVNQGWDLTRLSHDLLEHLRNLLVVRLMQQTSAAPAVKERDRECLLDLSDQEIAEAQSQMGGTSVDTLLDYLSFMAAADEEVARSATPRFALEAALVRLATLPKTLPVLELVDRLERLEKKISGGATPVRQTQAAAAGVEKPLTAATTQPCSDPATAWREFVAFVGKQKKLLASHLESATPVELSSQELQIGVAERHHLSYLQDAENAAALRALAQEFFASPLTVGIVAISAENATPPEGNVTQANERTPIVKEALRIFGGSVRTVRRDNG